MTVVLYDTTVRKQVEAALLESRRALEAAIVGSNAGVWRIDLDPQRPRFEPDYAYLSPQLKTLLGFTDEELPNSRSAWLGRVLPEDQGASAKPFGRTPKAGPTSIKSTIAFSTRTAASVG